jgi:Zn finger protein HypA/HybF involved in hydrogenase expression
MKKFILYALRWQASSIILAPCIYYLSSYHFAIAAIVSNAIGSIIFFWVDKYIFKNNTSFPLWEVQEDIKCVDCGQLARGYRLVKTNNYDKSKSVVEIRCEKCSKVKLEELKGKGVKV